MAKTYDFAAYTCQHCGAPLIDATSGLVCSRDWGCGGIRTGEKLPAPIRRRNSALLLEIPEVRQISHTKYDYKGSEMRLVKKITASLNGKMPWLEDDEWVVGLDGTDLVVLRPEKIDERAGST